jgi:hypothetical protein
MVERSATTIADILREDLLSEDASDSDYEPSTDDGEVDVTEAEESSQNSDYDDDNDDNNNCLEEVSANQIDHQTYLSRNCEEIWHSTPRRATRGQPPAQCVMRGKPGPTRYANREVDTIESAFKLFMKVPILRLILSWSNKEGQIAYGNDWKHIDEAELNCFTGLLIIAGVTKARNEPIIQLWNQVDGRPIFQQSMARGRFQQISRVLRFDDAASRRLHRTADKLQPIREIFDMWVATLHDCYIPHEYVTVDEQLVNFRGRCPFKQYIPSKPGKYGIKIWTLCDSKTSYVCNMQIYCGRNNGEGREQNQGERVVMDMVRGLDRSGRNVTCDNFFTSLSLARRLKAVNISLLGTVRKNRGELPAALTEVKGREEFSSLFAFQAGETLVSYCPKKGKVVVLLSTMHFQPEVTQTEEKKPLMILDYNTTKAGVDVMDQMVRTYTTKRMTRRWPMVIFYNMLDVSALNAFIIWMHLKPDWESKTSHRRRLFLLELGKSLVQANREKNGPIYRNPAENSRKRGRCVYCDRSKDLKHSTICALCEKFVCKAHAKIICNMCNK